MAFSYSDIVGTSPLVVLALTALTALIVKSFLRESFRIVFWASVAGILVSLYWAVRIFPVNGTAFTDMMLVGGFASFFDCLFLVIGLLTLFLSESYMRKARYVFSEYYILILLALIGMMMMGSAADLIIIFLGVELMSVCFYVLAGFIRTKPVSNEAALKYFLLGAFATGFLLYGIALIYGTAGTTNLLRIAAQYPGLFSQPFHVVGFGLLLVGLAFKVAAVPFHMWVPDVYEGSPTTISALMSTGGKAAAFSALLLSFSIPMSMHDERLGFVVGVLSGASMIIGNVIGLAQTNLKRMLAYSSIAHAGYMLVGIASGMPLGQQGIIFYAVSYGLTNLGAFGVVAVLEREDGKNLTYEEYAGLGTRKPILAALLSVFLFSLTGIPPFSGFVGKYYLFASAVESDMTWLAILGVVTSLVSTYYYLRVVMFMYFRDEVSGETVSVPRLALFSLAVSGAGVLLLGVFPSLILDVTKLLL